MIKSFNTGRLYTEAGQRIAYKTFDAGVLFADYDRGVSGFIPFDVVLDAPLSPSDVDSFKELVTDSSVLNAYDEFRYGYPSPEGVECNTLPEMMKLIDALYDFAKNKTNSMENK